MALNPKVDIAEILMRGGEQRVALLRYCVISVAIEPVFVFLAQEYRLRPTHIAALALYDAFCGRDALARIGAVQAIPPRNLQLQAAVECIRAQWARLQSPPEADERPGVPMTVPHGNLFDRVAEAVRNDPGGRFAAVANQYDPTLAPLQNLPGGKMNAVQRHFVEKVWRPLARPRLIAAGFWQIANIE